MKTDRCALELPTQTVPEWNEGHSETRWTDKNQYQCKYTKHSNLLACISRKYTFKSLTLQFCNRIYFLHFRIGVYLVVTYWTGHFLYTPPFIPQFPNLSPLIFAFSKHISGAFRAPVQKTVNLSKPLHCLKNIGKRKTGSVCQETTNRFTLNENHTFPIYRFTL